MKKLIVVAVAVLFAAGVSPVAMAGPQQERMKSCNAEAGKKDLKGDERKGFMKQCLSGKTPEAVAEGAGAKSAGTQQEKMKACNADAGKQGLKGDERKKFMSTCLKG